MVANITHRVKPHLSSIRYLGKASNPWQGTTKHAKVLQGRCRSNGIGSNSRQNVSDITCVTGFWEKRRGSEPG
jgi:hypothetical protein